MTNQKDLIYLAACAAEKAAAAIMKVYVEGLHSVSYKNDRSPLTQADMDANRVITEMLSKTGIPVLSEEGRSIPFEERKNWKAYWLVDPLDGTKEFINRNGEFTVNIALMLNNRPAGGVIVVPVWKKMYFALQGSGAYMLNNKEAVSLNGYHDMMSEAVCLGNGGDNEHLTIVASRSHINDETITFIEMMEQHFGKADYISRGSSLKFCILAEGKADIYPRFGKTMEWDTAAGHAIAMEAGCEITLADMKSPLLYNKEDLANGNFIVWRKDFIRRFQ
jgi:3'(2'), 5'-bisphosphate nucleotidase